MVMAVSARGTLDAGVKATRLRFYCRGFSLEEQWESSDRNRCESMKFMIHAVPDTTSGNLATGWEGSAALVTAEDHREQTMGKTVNASESFGLYFSAVPLK